jgi:RimJ/RimL family protein N-acetyltransferase
MSIISSKKYSQADSGGLIDYLWYSRYGHHSAKRDGIVNVEHADLAQHWPLFGLQIKTPRLEIRSPTDDDLPGLIAAIDTGVHDPTEVPSSTPWDSTPLLQQRFDSLREWWSHRATWDVDDWLFDGAVFVDGKPIGVQNIRAKQFAKLRIVSTGSWLGRRWQGQGLGKEMRAAVLHLAFEGLGALEARTEAYSDNERSLRVARAFGYVPDGQEYHIRQGQRARLLRFRLDRDTWLQHRRSDIAITGLDDCRDMFVR